jgi:hypothetical protein
MKTLLQLRVIVAAPPTGVAFAVQRGRADLLAPISTSADSLVFEFPVSVADASVRPPRLTGEFAQGSPSARFVYINSGTFAGQLGSCWSRRAKVLLSGITGALVQETLRHPRGLLEARILGVGRDGGPACATVPLLSEWAVVAAA